MNWLAHLFLSGPDIRVQLGSLLADVKKGREWEGMSEAFEAGLTLHRKIDSFADSHPVFKQSKERLGKSGRLRGVVVDLVYDHMLARNWERFSTRPLRDFIDGFYDAARKEVLICPEEAIHFLQSIVEQDRLGSYGETEGMLRALERIDARLSVALKKRECASSYFPRIIERYQELESDFLKFFPEVAAFAKSVQQNN